STFPSQSSHFAESGASPPSLGRRERLLRVPARSTRYVRHVSYAVVRESEPATREKVDSPELAAALPRSVIPDDGCEHFVAFLLSSLNTLTAVHHVSTGSLSASIAHPREVLGPAIREGAAHLVVAHNHQWGPNAKLRRCRPNSPAHRGRATARA